MERMVGYGAMMNGGNGIGGDEKYGGTGVEMMLSVGRGYGAVVVEWWKEGSIEQTTALRGIWEYGMEFLTSESFTCFGKARLIPAKGASTSPCPTGLTWSIDHLGGW
jgi:hypothetical protein